MSAKWIDEVIQHVTDERNGYGCDTGGCLEGKERRLDRLSEAHKKQEAAK